MRKRGGGNPNNNNGKSSFGNSSSAVSKLLSQNQTLNNTVNGSNGSYKDGQTILLEVREPIFAGPNSHNTTPMNGHRGSSTSAAGGDDDHHNHNSKSTMAQLNAKNHKLAKELVRSDRLKHSSLSRLVRLKKVALIFVSDYSFFKFIHSQPLLWCACGLTISQSEVRIRHREECKNVTRLTMENVSWPISSVSFLYSALNTDTTCWY